MQRRRTRDILSILLIMGALGALILFGQRSAAKEEGDRLRLEEVKIIRVALQHYFEAHGTFPDELPPSVISAQEYQYRCKGIETACADYELEFTLSYGSGEYGKGAFIADRAVIRARK